MKIHSLQSTDHIKLHTYLKCTRLEWKLLWRKEVLAAIKDRSGASEICVPKDLQKLLVESSAHRRRHLGSDGDIIVVHSDVLELCDLKEVGANRDLLSDLSKGRSPDELSKGQWGVHGEVEMGRAGSKTGKKNKKWECEVEGDGDGDGDGRGRVVVMVVLKRKAGVADR
jgi:hypothetical protein